MYTALLIGLVVLCLYMAQVLYERKVKKCLGHLPTLPRLPLVGSMYLVVGGGKVLFKVLMKVSEVMEAKQLPFFVWAGIWPVIVISDIEDCKTVTNTCIEKPYHYRFGKVWLGNGLVTAPGNIWKHNIKKIAGSFTRSVVDGYQEVFNAQAKKLINNLKMSAGSNPFDAMDSISFTTFETICLTALGVEDITDVVIMGRYYEAFNKIKELLIQRATNVLLYPDIIYQQTPYYKKVIDNVTLIHKVSETVIQKRKVKREVKKEMENSDDLNRPFKALIDVLLDLNNADPSFTEQQLQSEINTTVVGGQETVAISLLMNLIMLGSNDNVQKKLYMEMRSIFGNTDRDVTRMDLDRMVYCEAVINETLRLYPPFPAVMRQIDKDLQLKSCTVPKGTVCVLDFWTTGRLRYVFGDNAAQFHPERWMGENPPAPQMAFSIGKRSCIGKRYAMNILKTLLSYCVRELIFTSEADKLDFQLDCSLKPLSGHLLQVELR